MHVGVRFPRSLWPVCLPWHLRIILVPNHWPIHDQWWHAWWQLTDLPIPFALFSEQYNASWISLGLVHIVWYDRLSLGLSQPQSGTTEDSCNPPRLQWPSLLGYRYMELNERHRGSAVTGTAFTIYQQYPRADPLDAWWEFLPSKGVDYNRLRLELALFQNASYSLSNVQISLESHRQGVQQFWYAQCSMIWS